MAYRAYLLPTADRELALIVAYLNERSSNASSEFVTEYLNQLDLLCEGHVEYSLSRVKELAKLGYRVALVNKNLFLYYIDGDKLVVAHFFHQRQNYASLVASDYGRGGE